MSGLWRALTTTPMKTSRFIFMVRLLLFAEPKAADVAALFGLKDSSPAVWAFLKSRIDSAAADYHSYQDKQNNAENCQEQYHHDNHQPTDRSKSPLDSGVAVQLI